MAETIVSSGEVGGFPDRCKPLDDAMSVLAKKIEEHVRDPLNGYHRKPWGGKYGYTPRLGWSVRSAEVEGFDGAWVRVQKLQSGQVTSCDFPIRRQEFNRLTLAAAIRHCRRMFRNHVKGLQ